MDRIDPTKAAAVWQRVHSSAPPSRSAQALLTLIHDELADGTLYQQLARHFTGARSTQLLQMAKQEFSHAPVGCGDNYQRRCQNNSNNPQQ